MPLVGFGLSPLYQTWTPTGHAFQLVWLCASQNVKIVDVKIRSIQQTLEQFVQQRSLFRQFQPLGQTSATILTSLSPRSPLHQQKPLSDLNNQNNRCFSTPLTLASLSRQSVSQSTRLCRGWCRSYGGNRLPISCLVTTIGDSATRAVGYQWADRDEVRQVVSMYQGIYRQKGANEPTSTF